MYKGLLRILIILLIPVYCYSQTDSRKDYLNKFYFSNDTVIKRGTKFRVSNFALQINLGVTGNFHDQKTKEYLGNYWGPCYDFLVYYKNVIIGGSFQPSTIELKDTLHFTDGTLIPQKNKLEVSSNNLLIGYDINLKRNFSLTPYAVLAATSFSETKNQTVGYGLGFYLNKFIPVRPKRNLVVFINCRYVQSNYSEVSSSLGDNLLSISFGIGYKFWLLKKIE